MWKTCVTPSRVLEGTPRSDVGDDKDLKLARGGRGDGLLELVTRLATSNVALTVEPSSTRRLTRAEAMKPLAPVTR